MKTLFVLIRNDMALAYQGVQGGHAVAQFLIDHPAHPWKNETLVYVNVPDEEHLQMWVKKLSVRGIPWSAFREPDLGEQLTAVAAAGPDRLFSKLKLMGGA